MGLMGKFEKFWFEMLFKNVGKRCKTLATTIAFNILVPHLIVGVLVVLLGLFWATDEEEPLIGWISVVAGYVIFSNGCYKAELQSIMLYAKGELVETVNTIDAKLDKLCLNTAPKEPEEKKERKGEEKTDELPVTNKGSIPVITKDFLSEVDKRKIGEFLAASENCTRVSELLSRWNELDLKYHPIIVRIKMEIENAHSVERMYGPDSNRMKKLVEKIITILSGKE